VLRAWGFIEAPQVVDYPFRLIGESSGNFSTVENRRQEPTLSWNQLHSKPPFKSHNVHYLSRGANRSPHAGHSMATATALVNHLILYNVRSVKYRGGTMGNLTSALQQLREERKQAQARVESIDQAISVIESLNGTRTVKQAIQPTRVISAASRRKMARAQRARWAKARNDSQPIAVTKTKTTAPVLRTMSAAARKKIAAFQRARWAKIKAQQKKAA
jgi:phytoene dehydrogenase-like protein